MERCGSVIPAGRVALGRCLKSETLAWNKCNRLGFQGQKKKRAVGRHGNGRMPSAGPLDIENRLRQAGK